MAKKMKSGVVFTSILDKILPFLSEDNKKFFKKQNKAHSTVIQWPVWVINKKSIIGVFKFYYNRYRDFWIYKRSLVDFIWCVLGHGGLDKIYRKECREFFKEKNLNFLQKIRYYFLSYMCDIGLRDYEYRSYICVARMYDKNDKNRYEHFANTISRSLDDLSPLAYLMEPSFMSTPLDGEFFAMYIIFKDKNIDWYSILNGDCFINPEAYSFYDIDNYGSWKTPPSMRFCQPTPSWDELQK